MTSSKPPKENEYEYQRKGLHRGRFRTPHPQGPRQDRAAVACGMRARCPGRRGPDAARRGRLLLRRRRARPGRAQHGRLHRPELPPCGLHRHRRVVLPRARVARGAGHRGGQVQRRPDHAGRPAALGIQQRHHAAQLGPERARRAFRAALWRGHRQQLRAGGRAPHARLGNHGRAACLDQGGSLHPCAIQPQRHAAPGGDCCRRARLVGDIRPAAPPGLLRGERWWRRAHRDAAGNRQNPEAPDSDRARRG